MEKRQIVWQGKVLCYWLERKSVKNLNLRLKAGGILRVSAGWKVPLSVIDAFVCSKGEWIQRHLQERTEPPESYGSVQEGFLLLEGKKLPVHTVCAQQESVYWEEKGLTIALLHPEDLQRGELLLKEWQLQAFSSLLENRCRPWEKLFQEKFQISPPKRRIKLFKSKWGSCNLRTHEITYNLRLFSLPPACLEYVIVHEMSHFLHPNHSPSFHTLVEKLLPGAREIRRVLKQYRL